MQRFAQRVFLAGAAATAVALAYVLWHRWGGLVGAKAWQEAFLYYVLPLTAFGGALVFLAVWPRIDRFFILLLLAAAMVASVSADLYVGYAAPDEEGPSQQAAQRLNFPYDARSSAQVVADLRAQGVRAFPFIRLVSDPNLITLGIVPNAVAVMCNEFGPWFTPKMDRYGFANPDEIWDERAPLDAVLLGDSIVTGQCDPVTGGFAGLLRKQGGRILNLGIGGNEPLLDYASLAEFGSNFKSRFVIWIHSAGNDLTGMQTNRKYPILLRYLDDPSFRQHLADRMPEVERRLIEFEPQVGGPRQSFWSYMWSRKGVLRSLRLYTLRSSLGIARNVNQDIDFALFERTLQRARDTAVAMGAQLVVVNFPAAGQVNYDSVIDDQTAKSVKAAGVMFIDLKPDFRKVDDYQSLYSYRSTGHLTPAGNELVARVLSDIIAKDTRQ